MTTTTISISRVNRDQIDQLGALMRQAKPELWAGSQLTANTIIGHALDQAIRELEETQALKEPLP